MPIASPPKRKDPPPPLIDTHLPNQDLLLVGPKGSSKSKVLRFLLTRPEFWDNHCVIVLFSPHVFNDDSSEDCWELFRELKGRLEWHNTVTEANVRHAIRKRSDSQWSLIIFDDLIVEMTKKCFDSTLALGNLVIELIFNLRHSSFHLRLCNQIYKEPQLKK